MISGIILAAGSSQRMGTPKALLKIGEKTFLRHVVENLRSARIEDIIIVLGSEADEIKSYIPWFKGKIAVNDQWQKGQITSIVTGIDSLDLVKTVPEEIDGAIICPVDHPLLSQSLLVDILQGYWISKKKIIVPAYKGRRGHPVIFDKTLFDDLRKAPVETGARAVIRDHPEQIHEVAVNDEGVLINIDTPEDYDNYIIKR